MEYKSDFVRQGLSVVCMFSFTIAVNELASKYRSQFRTWQFTTEDKWPTGIYVA